MALKAEKDQLMETRKVMRKEAEIQKKTINQAFEKMKTKGKMDPKLIEQLGISTNSQSVANPGSYGGNSPKRDRNKFHGSIRGSIQDYPPPPRASSGLDIRNDSNTNFKRGLNSKRM